MSIHPWDPKKPINWYDYEIDNFMMQISNEAGLTPPGLSCMPEFLSEIEVIELLELADQSNWKWEGFSQRRRVQRYDASETNLPELLKQIMIRFKMQTNHTPKKISLEEYPFQSTNPSSSTAIVTTFESLQDPPSHDDCFVAQVALLNPVVQHLNQPKKRLPDCWQLVSPNHWNDIKMNPRGLFIKKGPALWDWRRHFSRLPECNEKDRVVVLKFSFLPENEDVGSSSKSTPDIERTEVMPPLNKIMTIVVTTSPIKSHPSTEVLQRTFETFFFAGPEFLKCQKIIVCDGVRIQDETGAISRKHANVKQALRNGIATCSQANNYEEFKAKLRIMCHEADEDSPFYNTIIEELSTRHGYGFALRHALYHCVKTPYVCVIQHDRTFMRPTPMIQVLETMWHNPMVKYVGISMRSNLMYREIFLSRYGKIAHDDLSQLVLRPKELLVDAKKFGPDSESIKAMEIPHEKLKVNIQSLKDVYMQSLQNTGQMDWLKDNPVPEGLHQMTLTPTIFWYDNTHVVDTRHYRDFIFDPASKMVAKGGFVEDKTSPIIVKTVERLGLAAGHERFGCYLLDDHSGMFFTGHLDGGSYIVHAEREKQFGPLK
jgi:hypothetical protein